MNDTILTNGLPVPDDWSHKEIEPDTGMQKAYIVLTEEERKKGFVKPVRNSYIHLTCKTITTMSVPLSETYARDPYFYSGTFCCECRGHFDLSEFEWEDGEPMDPLLQHDYWAREVMSDSVD